MKSKVQPKRADAIRVYLAAHSDESDYMVASQFGVSRTAVWKIL